MHGAAKPIHLHQNIAIETIPSGSTCMMVVPARLHRDSSESELSTHLYPHTCGRHVKAHAYVPPLNASTLTKSGAGCAYIIQNVPN